MITVVEWESLLIEKIAYVELLGELNLSAEEARDLGQAIAQLVKRNERSGSIAAIDLLRRQYPTSLAVYLVFKGIYSYSGGDYWSAVGEETGLTSDPAHTRMGQCFEMFLQENNLPLFRGLNGLRYVAPILLHGGIPDYSLPDFFLHFLQRMLAHATTNQADASDFITEWLYKYASAAPADKPIRRFLEYGGNFVLDFVTRCLELSEYYEERRELPTPESIGLPPRVLATYKAWSDENQQGTRRQTRLRLMRPTVTLDPWGNGPVLELPSQTLPHATQVEDGRWIIRGLQPEREIETFPLGAAWSEKGWETDPYQFELPAPGNYSITLEAGGQKENRALRTWYFNCILSASSLPLLAFDWESGALLTLRETLPARHLWLLLPRKQKLQVPGGSKTEVVEQFTGAWARFKVEAWDLRHAEAVNLGDQSVPVEPDLAQFIPYLQGQVVNEIEPQPGQPQLFTGHLPDLFIPLPPQRDPAIEAQRWRVTITAIHGNQRDVLLTTLLADSNCQLAPEENALHVALRNQEALNTMRQGLFEIALRGPLGRDITFQIAVISVLQIQIREQDRVRIPVVGNAPSLTFILVTDKDVKIESSNLGISIQSRSERKHHVQVSGECSRADLQLCFDTGQTESKIPFSISLPILTWAISEGQSTTLRDEHWQTRVINRPQAWPEQSATPRLLVALSTGNQRSAPHASLLVQYSRQDQPHELLARGRSKSWLTFNLLEAIDSVRACRDGSILLELELTKLPGLTNPLRVPVLRLEQTLGLTSLALEGILVEQTWLFELDWQETIPFRNRHLLLWSRWKPWEEALDIALPDHVQGHFAFECLLDRLAPGGYRAELTLIDPWSGSKPVRPFTRTANVIDLTLGSIEERIAHLRHVSSDLPGQLEHLLAAENEPYRQRQARELTEHMAPRFVLHILTALLTLQEQETPDATTSTFTILQELLLHVPVDLLAAIARLSLPLAELARRPFEELLWRIAPECEALLRQIYQDATVEFTDLALLVPDLQQNHIKAEVFALLFEAGVHVRENKTESRSDLLEPLAVDLPEHYFTDHLLDSARLYLREIRSYALLTAEQEHRLAQKIQQGREAEQELQELLENGAAPTMRNTLLATRARAGKTAREQLANANLRLVVSVAKRYMGRADFLDIIQNGNLGLLRAIDKFDGVRGYKFSTYATWSIRQGITRKLMDETRLVRLPVYILEDMGRLKKLIEELRQSLNREPDDTELVEVFQHPLAKIKELRALLSQPVQPLSLDAPLGEEDETLLGELLEQEESDPQDIVINSNLRDLIDQALSYLKPRERDIIELRFGLHDGDKRTLEEIGQMRNVTRERIRQIEEKALEKLKSPKLRALFSDYYVYVMPKTNKEANVISINRDVIYKDGRKKEA